METFNFPYHTFSTEYPESGTRIVLGGNYTFTAPPNGPDNRKITLSFPTMFYYVMSDGITIDATKNPTYNMATLEAFYNRNKLNKAFYYPHPIYGSIRVRFNTPLKIPEGNPGGLGSLKDFTIELMEDNN